MATAEYNESMGDMDIIFCGGGTAACVTAGRLAKANPDLKILMIEGGRNNYQDPTVVNPAVFLTHLAPDSKTAILYKSKPSEHLNGRAAVVPMGGIFGGGSSINFMMYTRAQGVDFDSWNTPGWSAKDMLEMCKKLETFHQDEPGIDKSKHGYSGPIHISDGGYRAKSHATFMDTVKKMGFKEIVDLQDLEQCDGFSRWQRYAGPDGKRSDAAHGYIHPLLQDGQHPNLHILLNSKVVRVIFDETSNPPRAVGVEYAQNVDSTPVSSLKPATKTVKANKLVVVTAGALGSPLILERSGVGNAEMLKKIGVPVVANVPGVGEAYQDHHLLLYPYKTSLPDGDTLDVILAGRKDFAKALEEKDPILGWNSIDCAAKLRMTDEDAKSLGPEFAADYARDFAPYPSKPVMLGGVVNAFLADPSLVEAGNYMTMGAYTAYPYSRGSIHITDPNDLNDGYEFDTGFLNHPSDIKKQLWAYKLTREIARNLPYYRGELGLGHPKFPEGSQAALLADLSLSGPNPHLNTASSAPGALPKLQYTTEDDAAIEDWIRTNLNTTWHSCGTCAMKPFDKGGVLDGDLNVFGTRGLKVADLSITPENVGANTNNTALAVGEKAAVIIGRELGIEV